MPGVVASFGVGVRFLLQEALLGTRTAWVAAGAFFLFVLFRGGRAWDSVSQGESDAGLDGN